MYLIELLIGFYACVFIGFFIVINYQTNKIVKSINDLRSELSRGFKEISENLEELNNSIHELSKEIKLMRYEFEKMNKSLERIENSMDRIENSMDRIADNQNEMIELIKRPVKDVTPDIKLLK